MHDPHHLKLAAQRPRVQRKAPRLLHRHQEVVTLGGRDHDVLAANGIHRLPVGGDQLDAWFDAGARAVLLAGALYSPALLASGDRMMIRNHAAAAHREATRFARTGTTTAATTGRDV